MTQEKMKDVAVMDNFNLTHPEMEAGERFYSNMTELELEQIKKPYLRMGIQAYDVAGNPILTSTRRKNLAGESLQVTIRPVFIREAR